ncbi:HesB/IscA family protein [Galactobacter valiniphilus]|uniref:HesB/IscA family protein n=1 Tax=Galactobacter valiniphilus TaxID=2676122 RepID=UPI003736613F
MNDHVRLPPFTVSRAAIDQIEALGGTVRIGVEPGGCAGSSLNFALPGPGASRAVRFGCPGAWLEVEPAALEALRGATLDYSARIRPPRFRVLRNPSTSNACPCKRSFGDPWPGAGHPACRAYLPMPWDDEFEPPERWKRQTGYKG